MILLKYLKINNFQDPDAVELKINPTDGEVLKSLKISLNHTVEKIKKRWKPSVFAK